MEQLPLTFIQSTVEPDIQECFTPAFNFTRINSSNGRLAFTTGKIYWLPEAPIAMLDQGWVIKISEVAGCDKYGISGFIIRLVDGKELRFSNVGAKMREGIKEAIEAHREDTVTEEPAVEAAAEPESQAAPESAPEDASSNKLMGILAYLGILVLIPLFAAKESKFVRFHVNQGLILLICSIVILVVGRIFPALSILVKILDVAIVVLTVIGIINVVKGEAKELPLVGKFRIIS
jgi:uncharacterized membrane protein